MGTPFEGFDLATTVGVGDVVRLVGSPVEFVKAVVLVPEELLEVGPKVMVEVKRAQGPGKDTVEV